MRGSPALHRRAGAKPESPSEATAQIVTIPAPYGGWNARGNLANMPATDAVIMDNFFPGVQDVALRKGSEAWSTGFPANIKSLLVYNSATASKLFASTDAGIYDATSQGVVGASVAACTNGLWSWANYATTGGSYLTLVNGVDNMKLYDGATWTTITGVSVPAITGIATTSLEHVNLHKKRLWFTEKNSMNLWYLPVDSIAGAAVRFPVGAIFRKGGKVLATATWTLDGGNGSDDYFIIATSKGEIAVYQGTDPASSSSWALIGVYAVGEPLGRQPFCNFGGDLLYLSKTGLVPLSKFAQSTVVDRSAAISYKIDGAFLSAAESYSANTAWQTIFYPSGNMLIVNIPTADTPTSVQFVMNSVTQAWCQFRNWNAAAWAIMGSSLFFAGGTSVKRAWTGTADSGAGISGSVLQAYNQLGYKGQKHVEMFRPTFSLSGNATLRYSMDTDFAVFGDVSQLSYINPTLAVWDSSVWDTAVWDSGLDNNVPDWLTVGNTPGYYHALRQQITTSSASFTWTSTTFSLRPMGIL